MSVGKEFLKPVYRSGKHLFLNLSQVYYGIFRNNKFECNVCHFKTNKFNSNTWHLYCNCPNCNSDIRHRLLIASLELLDDVGFSRIFDGKKILHFAPEKEFGDLIKKRADKYFTADFLAEGYSYKNIDYNIDISDMKMIGDASFDCVIACDVLEHVPDHKKGILEVYRILKKGGYCIFTVPQKDNLKVTFEDASITDKEEREKIFGQWDHLRIYGSDFVDIMQDCGFKVTAVDQSYFDKKDIEYYVLAPPVISSHPLATNFRKIFFGLK